MRRRALLLAGLAGPAAASVGLPQPEAFREAHAGLYARFVSTTAQDECGSAQCVRSVVDIRRTMRGNCRDFGVLLIDECLTRGVRDVAAVWCLCSGVPHLVVLHVPSMLVGDNQVPEARPLTRRPDLEQLRVLWPVATRAGWESERKVW